MSGVSLVNLGRTGIKISPIGLGTWQWGDKMMWDYGKSHTDQDIQAAFEVSLQAGINFYDTAEVYGMGRSERLLGQHLAALREAGGGSNLVIASKFFPFPWRLWKGRLRAALKNSLERLELKQVDLYQIHWPFPPISVETWAEALGEAVKSGLVRAVGVSNYNIEQTRRAYGVLKHLDIPLASDQVEFSLLERKVEKNGLLPLCQELGITLIAYSPIAKGMLTGKYTPTNPPPGARARQYNQDLLARIQPLIALMREIGQGYAGKTPVQVALNWVLCKGGVAIPGAKNARQAQENAGALGWSLNSDEMSALDQASDAALQARPWLWDGCGEIDQPARSINGSKFGKLMRTLMRMPKHSL